MGSTYYLVALVLLACALNGKEGSHPERLSLASGSIGREADIRSANPHRAVGIVEVVYAQSLLGPSDVGKYEGGRQDRKCH